jgi:uncharacterized coiled-coil protein SlyX
MSETEETKTAGKGVIIALGIICVILVVSLFGVIAYYTITIRNKESELNSANIAINQLNATIARQNDTIDALNTTVTNLQKQVALDNSTLTKLQNQIASDNRTITSLGARVLIDGITYSTTPTSYDLLFIGYFTLLPNNQSDPNMDFGMLWHNQLCWLLTPGEPTPPIPDLEINNGSSPLMMLDPDPFGAVMINGWLYSQIPTNLIAFTMPQFATPNPLWTYTANEPIPTGAQILNSTA